MRKKTTETTTYNCWDQSKPWNTIKAGLNGIVQKFWRLSNNEAAGTVLEVIQKLIPIYAKKDTEKLKLEGTSLIFRS